MNAALQHLKPELVPKSDCEWGGWVQLQRRGAVSLAEWLCPVQGGQGWALTGSAGLPKYWAMQGRRQKNKTKGKQTLQSKFCVAKTDISLEL